MLIVYRRQNPHQMTTTFDGKTIKQDPMTIMQLLAQRAECAERGECDGPEVAVSEMMDETDLSRGSIYNYLTNTLQPLGLAGVYDTRPTAGAAEDAKLWAITKTGYQWLSDLDPDDLAPAVASGDAVEKARKAHKIASDAQSAANRSSKRVSDLNDRYNEQVDSITSDLSTLSNRINNLSDMAADEDAMKSELADLSADLDDVRTSTEKLREEHQDEISNLRRRLETTESRTEDLDAIVRGEFDDENDNGHYGRVRTLESELQRAQRRVFATGAIAILALLMAVIIVIL